jgi:hypothetical protein
MGAVRTEAPVSDVVVESPPVTTAPRASGRWRWWPSTRLERVSAVVFTLALLVLLVPVLWAPVNADERFQFFVSEVRSNGSVWGVLTWTLSDTGPYAAEGRINPLGFFALRLEWFLAFRTAVALGIPIVAAHAVARLALLLLALWATRAFLQRVRSRGADGIPVGIAPERLALVLATAALAFALGATVQDQFGNGMTTYPVFTYTALTIFLGFPAIVLAWLDRLAVRWSTAAAVVGATVAVVLGVVLTISYELYYVAFPTMVTALVLQYVTGPNARRAKVLLLTSVTVAFGIAFAITRWITGRACAAPDSACYVGSEPAVGPGMLRTALLNIANSTPFFGWDASRADLENFGNPALYPTWPGNGLSVVVLVAAAAWLVLLLAAARRWSPVRAGEARAAGKAMLVVAGAGIGAAVVMAVSGQAQERISQFGQTYRNTFATWACIVLGGALLALLVALTARSRRRLAVLPFALVTVIAVGVGVFQFPLNVAVSQANVSATSVERRLADEVVVGEPGKVADARRCALVVEIGETSIGKSARRALLPNAAEAFERLHGFEFCSTGSAPRAN